MLAARSSLLCSLDLWRCRNLTDRGLVELVNGCRWGLFLPLCSPSAVKRQRRTPCELVSSPSGCWRSWTWAGAPHSRAAPAVSSTSLAAFLACADSSSLRTAPFVTQTSRRWLPAAPHCSTLTFWVRLATQGTSHCVGAPSNRFVFTVLGLLVAVFLATPFLCLQAPAW